MANLRDEMAKLESYGTSEGAQKAWDTRGRGRKSWESDESSPPKTERQATHLILTREGYRQNEAEPSPYEHPSGHTVRVSPAGNWTWKHADSDIEGIRPVKGSGGAELEDHLSAIH